MTSPPIDHNYNSGQNLQLSGRHVWATKSKGNVECNLHLEESVGIGEFLIILVFFSFFFCLRTDHSWPHMGHLKFSRNLCCSCLEEPEESGHSSWKIRGEIIERGEQRKSPKFSIEILRKSWANLCMAKAKNLNRYFSSCPLQRRQSLEFDTSQIITC